MKIFKKLKKEEETIDVYEPSIGDFVIGTDNATGQIFTGIYKGSKKQL